MCQHTDVHTLSRLGELQVSKAHQGLKREHVCIQANTEEGRHLLLLGSIQPTPPHSGRTNWPPDPGIQTSFEVHRTVGWGHSLDIDTS